MTLSKFPIELKILRHKIINELALLITCLQRTHMIATVIQGQDKNVLHLQSGYFSCS